MSIEAVKFYTSFSVPPSPLYNIAIPMSLMKPVSMTLFLSFLSFLLPQYNPNKISSHSIGLLIPYLQLVKEQHRLRDSENSSVMEGSTKPSDEAGSDKNSYNSNSSHKTSYSKASSVNSSQVRSQPSPWTFTLIEKDVFITSLFPDINSETHPRIKMCQDHVTLLQHLTNLSLDFGAGEEDEQ